MTTFTIAAASELSENLLSQVPGGSLRDAVKAMAEQAMSFNLQYLQLQSQLQNESRAYTLVSNIMKTKHDTVRNTISNLR